MKKNNILKIILRTIIITLCYYFISSYFFCINVKADFITGGTNFNPTQTSSWPNFFYQQEYYDNVRDVFNDIKNSTTLANRQIMGDIDDYYYFLSYTSSSGAYKTPQTTIFFTAEPTFTYDSVNNIYRFTVPNGERWYRFTRSWSGSSFLNSFTVNLTDSNLQATNNDISNLIFTNYNDSYIFNSNNFTLPTELLNYLTNIPGNNKITLDFNYGVPNVNIYYNEFYLNGVLVGSNSCSSNDLTVGRFYSCPFDNSEGILADKVVSRMLLSSVYLPNEFWYNKLGWDDTTDRYYNFILGGAFPSNSNLESFRLVSSSDSNVSYNANILDTQSTVLMSQNYVFDSFVNAFNWTDTTLTNYNLLEATIIFPESTITHFDIWEEGFNQLSDNYIQENIDLAGNKLQQELINNMNGNTVSTDNYFNFFTNFSVNHHGLSGFITLPLTYISHLSDTCSAISIPFPMMPNYSFTLPCMSSIYSQYLGAVFTMYQLILNGIITYWVALNCFKSVKNIHDPKHDKIEVVDL